MLNTEDTFLFNADRVQVFFNIVDKVAEAGGKNVPQIVKIEELRCCKQGSFGKALADFLDDNNLQPLTTGLRRKQLHDAIHVLTGYGSDPIGEAELQAFLLGAKFSLPNLFIGISLFGMIRRRLPNEVKVARERIGQAYQRGQDSNFNPDKWEPELLWDLSVNEVKARFCV